jgi:hypothetical protein
VATAAAASQVFPAGTERPHPAAAAGLRTTAASTAGGHYGSSAGGPFAVPYGLVTASVPQVSTGSMQSLHVLLILIPTQACVQRAKRPTAGQSYRPLASVFWL